MKNTQKQIAQAVAYLFLIAFSLLSLFPFYFMFVCATNSNREILKIPPKMTFGTDLLENFRALSERINIPRVMFNSLLVAVIFTVLSIIVYSMAGYALAKYQFKGKKIVFLLVMLTMMLPAQVTYIPRYMLMTKLGGVDQYWSVIIPPLANAFGIFLMRQNMYSIPNALIEAARLDGCNEYTTFIRIVIPNIKPAISALGIYMFMNSWNNFMWPLIMLNSEGMQTWQLALSVLNGSHWTKDYGLIMLAASLTVLPILLIFLFFQKYFVLGAMGSAVKE